MPHDAAPPAALIAADEPGAAHVSALYEWLAERARRSLEITDAYLVTPPGILSAFEAAARRGVDGAAAAARDATTIRSPARRRDTSTRRSSMRASRSGSGTA